MAALTSAPPSGTATCLSSPPLPRLSHPLPSSSPYQVHQAKSQSSHSLSLHQHRRQAALRPAAVPAGSAAAAAAAAEASDPWVEDRSIQVKLMLAESSGRLDLSDCGLTRLPPGVFDLDGLEDLSLAGNQLTELSADIGRLTALKRLQLAGNQLRALPESISALVALEGAWLHGNLLEALPEGVAALGALTQLSLAGNCLRALPQQSGGLTALKELSLAGNQLEALPASLGQLAALTKLSLHGNRLGPGSLPDSLPGLEALEELWLQGNPALTRLPAELGQLPRLKHLSAADCALECVPAELGSLPALQTLSLYGNRLGEVSPALCQAPQLKQVWVEGNPLSQASTAALLEAAAASPSLTALGMDTTQLESIPGRVLEAVGSKLRPCGIHGSGPGYFKLDLAHGCWGAQASSGGSGGSGNLLAGGGSSMSRPQSGRAQLLVVSFGSAPGTPNWGGVLGKVRAAGSSSSPGQDSFDVLYVVDPHRAWYGGGDDEAYLQYAERLGQVTTQYEHVVFIGDSMGATAALLFAELATSVHAFCPQIDLSTSSIRPGQPGEWHAALRERVMQSVQSSRAQIQVHVGNWSHDLDQARLLPPERVHVKIYSVDSHRLALYLDKKGKLQQVIRGAVSQELGLPSGQLRLTNLV